MTRPTEAFIEQIRNDEDGVLTVLSAVSLLLPVVVLVDVLLDLAERVAGFSVADPPASSESTLASAQILSLGEVGTHGLARIHTTSHPPPRLGPYPPSHPRP